MIRIPPLSALALVLLTVGATARASSDTPVDTPVTQEQRVDNRQQRQAERITGGVESGQITQREQGRLNRQQQGIERLETRIESDGTVTRNEAFRMEKAQDRASHTIGRAAHDRQGRGNRTR